MPPAVAAAGIGAAASIGGGLLGASAAKQAAKTAAKAQVKVANKNNALAREQFAQSALRIDPYAWRGNQAGGVLNELLLGPQGGGTGGSSGGSAGPTAQQQLDYLLHSSGNKIENPRRLAEIQAAGTPEQQLAYALSIANDGERQYYDTWMLGQQSPYANPPGGGTTTGTGGSALSAWDQFRNSTNYQFRLNEGNKAVNQGYAARGALQSGAAQIALQERGQQFASNELGNWMQALANQQGVGLSAANALAGVGTNMVNQISANNNMAGDARANSALAQGQAQQQMWGGIANGVGQIAGAFGSSYGNSGSSAYNGAQSGFSSPYSFYQGIGNYGG